MKILTIAVPAYNMEKYLFNNLQTFCDKRLNDDLEVIVVNNASSDKTAQIAQNFAYKHPSIFKLIDKKNNTGYGSSVNTAIQFACGKYFRVVDADDWVDTEQLLLFLKQLKKCSADIVQTNYQIVNVSSLQVKNITMSGVKYNFLYNNFLPCYTNLPCIHSTTYKLSLLKENHVLLQENTYYVDEELVIIPFIYAKNVIFQNSNVYRYRIGNVSQSTSPGNRAKYFNHRERVIWRLIKLCEFEDIVGEAKLYYNYRVILSVKDHLTTLYQYIPDRKRGRTLARDFLSSIRKKSGDIYCKVLLKSFLLRMCNYLHINLNMYNRIKGMFDNGPIKLDAL